jgi:hypothetical protein
MCGLRSFIFVVVLIYFSCCSSWCFRSIHFARSRWGYFSVLCIRSFRASLAAVSAFSLPENPTCPGTQNNVIITFGPCFFLWSPTVPRYNLSSVGVSSFLLFASHILRRIRLLFLSWTRLCESSYGVRIYLSISGFFPHGNVDCWILVQLHIVRNHVVGDKLLSMVISCFLISICNVRA